MKKPYIMKFGKFKDQPLTSTTTEWLVWALNNLDPVKTNGSLFRILFEELATRAMPEWEVSIKMLLQSNTLPHGGLWRHAWRLPNGEVAVLMEFSRKRGLSLQAAVLFPASGGAPRKLSILRSLHSNGRAGIIDKEATDWVTLDPNGGKTIGKMLIAPYYINFPHETYQPQIQN